ncbi:aminodeoxychorismate synthase component I [Litorimonas sp. RW-G-Af-16]|uniref:aminodeoxychorismate synthase component I n=1 Tax=Litorimonas sp. RW-G-Af-16 TaxID=3241168 RepID=UPI00390C695F
MPPHFALFDDQTTGRQLYFSDPLEIITITRTQDVAQAFTQIETALAAGHYVAGYFAYELGAALETKLTDLLDTSAPLIQIGVFNAPSDTPPVEMLYTAAPPKIDLMPIWSEADYVSRFDTLQAYIEAGDCYQVNLTFPMTGQTYADAAHIFAAFRQRQPGRYGALLSLGGADIISFSPELFFEKSGKDMRMRPMKGTRPRAGNNDQAVAEAMRAEPKSQAENLMIVDLLRNDLSRLAEVGSVEVPELFALETYPTVHQMTSQVTATLRDGVSWLDIFKGLFPCGSVTGAPKIRAMEIIHELEAGPRGPYCGAIGFIAPSGDACFNVAIRTAVLQDGALRYDVGSGVVLDSEGADEYRECLLKSQILTAPPEQFIETLYWSPEAGYRHEDAHVARLEAASGQSLSDNIAMAPLNAPDPQRVRWIFHQDRTLDIISTDYVPLTEPLPFLLSKYPLTPTVQRTDIKTSRRDFYDGERRRVQAIDPQIAEVVFLNAYGELTEGSFTSLFIKRGGKLQTPPLSAGLLPGTLRAKLIEAGDAIEAPLTLQDIIAADQIYLGNSLRGLMEAELIKPAPL